MLMVPKSEVEILNILKVMHKVMNVSSLCHMVAYKPQMVLEGQGRFTLLRGCSVNGVLATYR